MIIYSKLCTKLTLWFHFMAAKIITGNTVIQSRDMWVSKYAVSRLPRNTKLNRLYNNTYNIWEWMWARIIINQAKSIIMHFGGISDPVSAPMGLLSSFHISHSRNLWCGIIRSLVSELCMVTLTVRDLKIMQPPAQMKRRRRTLLVCGRVRPKWKWIRMVSVESLVLYIFP